MPVEPWQPHELVPDCRCEAAWSVEFVLSAEAMLEAEFDCDTDPLSPGLRTRMATFVFSGSICFADDAAMAACSFSADCPEIWTPVLPPPPACCCVLDWSAAFVLLASALLVALFDCETGPSFPGLSTRIETLVFSGFTCVADDAAIAACSFSVD